ncbi:Hypothetical protein R9X50_00169800 [Acrodontium crateriforme]|uniref:Uncharacterized protein n=1 Tax=Acrodontium crateriforme TaxID=150365 RepID=A0AAQ3LZY0_9PEZI|nr:Hypothetical protein R9X50_00169800 [Acrodontium crateriforme]
MWSRTNLVFASFSPCLARRTNPQSLHLHYRAMSEIKALNTKKAMQPVGPYSQAVQANNQIFVSGQLPADAAGNLVEGSIADKTKACCEGMKNILEDAGSSLSKVVKVNVFLTSMGDFAEMNSVYEQYFTHKPARSCVAVKELPKGVPVEIEAIALA